MKAFVYIISNIPKITRENILQCGLQPDELYSDIILYTGVTSGLYNRIAQHKKDTQLQINNIQDTTLAYNITPVEQHVHFSAHYHTDKLLYFETLPDINSAIKREKQLKKWKRTWKLELINTFNPHWNDLFFSISTQL